MSARSGAFPGEVITCSTECGTFTWAIAAALGTSMQSLAWAADTETSTPVARSRASGWRDADRMGFLASSGVDGRVHPRRRSPRESGAELTPPRMEAALAPRRVGRGRAQPARDSLR